MSEEVSVNEKERDGNTFEIDQIINKRNICH